MNNSTIFFASLAFTSVVTLGIIGASDAIEGFSRDVMIDPVAGIQPPQEVSAKPQLQSHQLQRYVEPFRN